MLFEVPTYFHPKTRLKSITQDTAIFSQKNERDIQEKRNFLQKKWPKFQNIFTNYGADFFAEFRKINKPPNLNSVPVHIFILVRDCVSCLVIFFLLHPGDQRERVKRKKNRQRQISRQTNKEKRAVEREFE
jgi:hypothetical protein